jgi:pyroglutamyl-peptidase
MPNILLTGFSPFDNETTNPSWEAVRPFAERKILDNHVVHVAQLPCEFGHAVRQLEALIHTTQAEIVVCLGQAGGRAEISVERVAINIDDARIPDNLGLQPIDQAIVLGGPAAYFSSLPIKAITQKLKEQGIPANVSQSAGTYVCNHVFYGLMHYANTAPWLKRAGFVHIPYLPVQACAHAGTPSMSLAMMGSAINTILEVCVAQKTDLAITGGTIC